MTTLVGIKAHEPNLKKDYVLLASDSRWTNKGYRDFGYNSKKIFSNSNKNLIIGHSGVYLFSPKNFFYSEEKEIIKNFISKKYGHLDDVFEDMEEMNKENVIDFIFGIRGNDGPELCFFYKKLWNPFEKFLVSKQDKKFFNINFELYSKWESNNICVAGSGSDFAYEKLTRELMLVPKINDHFVISVENLLNSVRSSIIESKKNDVYTGGMMNLGILTNENTFTYQNFMDLDEKRNFEISKITALLKKMKSEVKTKNHSLENDLVI